MKQDGPQDMHLVFFRYKFLNALRDELGLTVYFQKVTLFHFMMLLTPTAGIAVGFAWGEHTHNLWKEIIGCVVGLVLGIGISWPTPKLIWKMLCFFAREGWFMRPEILKSMPVMTPDEFNARREAFEREEWPQKLIWLIITVGAIYEACQLGDYVQQTKWPMMVEVLINIAVGGFILGMLFSWFPLGKRLWRKHKLLCLACGRKIADAAGLIRVPYMGLCKHCGAKVVEIKVEDSSPG